MAEKSGTTATANKLAMSRALGAAFLNHQVEQLEKSVSNGPASGNWRDRRQAQTNSNAPQAPTTPRGVITYNSKRPTSGKLENRKKDIRVVDRSTNGVRERERGPTVVTREATDTGSKRRSSEEEKDEKDADILVVDASVLVNALYQVKKWCRDGREEVLIVPLEALNTLDLLKKGTTSLAQRARAASRILEAQVGTNPRIRVQRDDAFVPWDKITFKDKDTPPPAESKVKPPSTPLPNNSPEWVRRTICCAQWEIDNATPPKTDTDTDTSGIPSGPIKPKPKVVLAVLASASLPPPNLSLPSRPGRLSPTSGVSDPPTLLTPVPLPAPSLPHGNKHEPRSTGTLIAEWAARAGIEMIEVQPTIPGITSGGGGGGVSNATRVEDDDRSKQRPRAHSGARATGGGGKSSAAHVGLVERPPAVMAMMEMVAQPSKVVRVLARGEKLDPDS